MSGPETYRKPLIRTRTRSEGGWFAKFDRWLGRDAARKKPPEEPLPPGSGMPADPPGPKGPPLSGGAEATLDYDAPPKGR